MTSHLPFEVDSGADLWCSNRLLLTRSFAPSGRAKCWVEMGRWGSEGCHGLNLEGSYRLSNSFEVVSEEGPARVLTLSPVGLAFGKIELYALWKAWGVLGTSAIRTPRLDKQRDDQEDGESKKEQVVAMHIPSIHANFSLPGPRPTETSSETDVLFGLTLQRVAIVGSPLGGQIGVKQVVLADHREDSPVDGFSLVSRRRKELGVEEEEEEDEDEEDDSGPGARGLEEPDEVVMNWRKAKGGTGDVTIQLVPSVLRLDTEMLPPLVELATFRSMSPEELDRRGGYPATPRLLSRRARGARQPSVDPGAGGDTKSFTMKFISDESRVVLVEGGTERGLEAAQDDEGGEMVLDVAQFICCHRTLITRPGSPPRFEMYLNLVGVRVRSVLPSQVRGGGALSFLDHANVFVSQEMTQGGVPFVSVNMDHLSLHLYPEATQKVLHPLCQALATAFHNHARQKEACSSTSLPPSTRPSSLEACQISTLRLAQYHVHFVAVDPREDDESCPSPVPVQPGTTLLSPALPHLVQTSATRGPRDQTFVSLLQQDVSAAWALEPLQAATVVFSFQTSHPARAISFALPEVLHLPNLTTSEVLGRFPVILELATQPEGVEVEQGVGQGLFAAVGRAEMQVAVQDGGGSSRAGGKGGQRRVKTPVPVRRAVTCDHSMRGRVWQVSMSWAQSLDFPLARLWRALVLAVAQHLSIETFEARGDRVNAVLQVALPQTHVKVYPLHSEEELAHVRVKELKVVARRKGHVARKRVETLVLATGCELEVVDLSRWILIPAAQAEGFRLSYSQGEYGHHLVRKTGGVEVKDENSTSTSLQVKKARLNVSRRIVESLAILKQDHQGRGGGEASSRNPCFRYNVVNEMRHAVWFGQHLTTEMIKLGSQTGE